MLLAFFLGGGRRRRGISTINVNKLKKDKWSWTITTFSLFLFLNMTFTKQEFQALNEIAVVRDANVLVSTMHELHSERYSFAVAIKHAYTNPN